MFLVATNWLSVRVPIELGAGIDALRAGEREDVLRAAWLIASMGVGILLVRTLSRALVFTPGRNVEADIRNDVLANVLRLGRRDLGGLEAGDLVSRSTNDIGMVRAMVGFGPMQVVNVISALVLTGREMLAISPKLTGLVLLPVLLAVALAQGMIRSLLHLARRSQRELSDLSDQLLSSFQGVGTIQAFGAEAAFMERMKARNDRYLHTIIRVAIRGASLQPILAASAALALYLLLSVGGTMTVDGAISVGELAAFSTLLLFLVSPLRSLGWLVAVVQRGRASMERVYQVLDLEPDRPDLEDPAPPLPPGSLGVQLRGLTCAYPSAPDTPALKDITADIEPGRMVGLFGRTGSGKSTLIKILCRTIEPDPGMVRLGGPGEAMEDIRRVDLDHLRRRISLVPQAPFLFTRSLAWNISLGRDPGGGEQRGLERAARQAALDQDLQRLPQGLETVVGERGVTISGGQRQRVALARGFMKPADLILLDDVLSAVDHDTEQRLVDAIDELRDQGGQRPTVLVASNRLSVLAHADHILVLDEGRLRDQGTHAELVERPGPYREAWLAQRSPEADGGEP